MAAGPRSTSHPDDVGETGQSMGKYRGDAIVVGLFLHLLLIILSRKMII